MKQAEMEGERHGNPLGGVLGDGLLHAGKGNMALVRFAIRAGWPISDEIRQQVVDQMALIVGQSEDERNRIAASKVLVAADSVNARREATQVVEDNPAGNVNVKVNVDTRPPIDLSKLTDAQLAALEALLEAEQRPALPSVNGKHEPGTNGHFKEYAEP